MSTKHSFVKHIYNEKGDVSSNYLLILDDFNVWSFDVNVGVEGGVSRQKPGHTVDRLLQVCAAV
jgi:hypothetical protein